MPIQISPYALYFAVFAFVGYAANADVVSETLQTAMSDCVSLNAGRIGSPIPDVASWATVVGSTASVSFSLIQLTGANGQSNFQAAVIAKTEDLLIATLEESGFKESRPLAIKTVEYCMPFAWSAAASKLETQKHSPCPDDTDYKKSIQTIQSTDEELKTIYGSYAKEVRKTALWIIGSNVSSAFPDIFFYGTKDFPRIEATDGAEGLDAALLAFSGHSISDLYPFVSSAISAANSMKGSKPTRVEKIKSDLVCLTNWLEIYPTKEIAQLTTK